MADYVLPIVKGYRWLFLFSLIYAPWAVGCTTPLTIHVLNILLAICGLGFLSDLIAFRRFPSVPLSAALPITTLLLMGWWMVFNAKSAYDSSYHIFGFLSAPFPALPGSIAQQLSSELMVRITTLSIAFFISIASTLISESFASSRPITTEI